jgi:hypothetical protein
MRRENFSDLVGFLGVAQKRSFARGREALVSRP